MQNKDIALEFKTAFERCQKELDTALAPKSVENAAASKVENVGASGGETDDYEDEEEPVQMGERNMKVRLELLNLS